MTFTSMEPNPPQQPSSLESGSQSKSSQLAASIEAQNKELGGKLLEFLTSDNGSVSLFRIPFESSNIIFIGGVDREQGPILISGQTANDLIVNGNVQIPERLRGKDLKNLIAGRPADLIMDDNPTSHGIWKNALAASEKNAEDLKKAEEKDKYIDLAIVDAELIFGNGRNANVLPPTTPEQKSAYGAWLPKETGTATPQETIGNPAMRGQLATPANQPPAVETKVIQAPTETVVTGNPFVPTTLSETPKPTPAEVPNLPESQPRRSRF